MITQGKFLLICFLSLCSFLACTNESQKQATEKVYTPMESKLTEKQEDKVPEIKPIAESLESETPAEARVGEEDKTAEQVEEKEESISKEELARQKRREKRRKERREKRRKERERKQEEERRAAELAQTSTEVTLVEEPTTIEVAGDAAISFYEKTHNYGTILQGEKVNYKFKFRNTGRSELVISNVNVSCGCTQPSYPFIPIAPGEEGFIGVNFDSAGRLGKQRPTITVITNANPKSYELHLEGFVDAEREKTPVEPQDTL